MFWRYFLPNPIFFSVGPLTIHWYGLILVVAIIAAALVARHYFIKKSVLSSRQFEDLVFYIIIFGLIGARFGHVVFFNFDYYLHYPIDILKVWQGGLAIQGALFGGFITTIVWAHRHKINFWKITDGLALSLPLGQAIGRWGNYFNQELFGRPTEAWWGIPIESVNRVAGYQSFSHFHPIFFYESILNLALFFILYRLAFKKSLSLGNLTLFYIIGYGIIRFTIEFVRIDETFMLGGIRIAQIISLIFIFVIYYIYKLSKKHEKASQ